MTMDELEKWLALLFYKHHFLNVNPSIETTPHARWREGLPGTKTLPARGLPRLPFDEENFRIDFMPIEERAISAHGVEVDLVTYFDNILRPYVGLRDPQNPTRSHKHRFRRNPKNVSELLFFEKTTKRYYQIRSTLPPMSIWELRQVRQIAKDRGVPKPDERQIRVVLNEMRAVQDESAEKTKTARIAQQQRAQHKKERTKGPKPTPDIRTSQTPHRSSSKAMTPQKYTQW